MIDYCVGYQGLRWITVWIKVDYCGLGRKYSSIVSPPPVYQFRYTLKTIQNYNEIYINGQYVAVALSTFDQPSRYFEDILKTYLNIDI